MKRLLIVLLLLLASLAVVADYATNVTVIEEVDTPASAPELSDALDLFTGELAGDNVSNSTESVVETPLEVVEEPVEEVVVEEPTVEEKIVEEVVEEKVEAPIEDFVKGLGGDAIEPIVVSDYESPVVVEDEIAVTEEIVESAVAPELDDALDVMVDSLVSEQSELPEEEPPLSEQPAVPLEESVEIVKEELVVEEVKIDEKPILSSEFKIVEADGAIVSAELTTDADTVMLKFDSGPVKSIELSGVKSGETFGVEEVPMSFKPPIEGVKWAQIYAIDPTNVSFVSGTVEVLAKGTSLYKCKDWVFDSQTCIGTWELIAEDMVPGNTYKLAIDALDPAFGEIIAVAAEHLDENYTFISDIYSNISAIDNVWSEPIPAGHFVRVTFEHELEDGNVIDFLARDNGTVSYLEIYVANTSTLVGRSGIAGIAEMQYVELSNIPAPTKVFDLKVVKHYHNLSEEVCDDNNLDCADGSIYENSLDGFIEFDFIHDALINGTVADGIVVYVESAVTTPRYRIWNGTNNTVSAELSASATSDDGRWTVLRANPEQDQFILGVLDASTNTSAQVWNGTAWSSVQALASDSPNVARRSFDLAFEHSSGEALVVFEDSTAVNTNVGYRTWSGSSWSSGLSFVTNASTVHWVKTVPRKNSNDIMVLLHDVNNDLFGILWNGTAFDNATQFNITGTINDVAEQSFDFVWMGTSGNGLVVYSNSTTAFAYRTFTYSSKTWSSDSIFLTLNGGAAPNGMRLCGDPTSNYAGFVSQDTTDDGNFLVWNGTGVETSPAPPAEETAMEANGVGAMAMDCAFESVSGNATFMYVDDPASEDNQFRICTYNKTAWSNSSMTDCPITSSVISGASSMESFKLYPSPVNNSIVVLAQNVLEDLGIGRWNGSTVTNDSVIETSLECLNGGTQCVDFAWVQASVGTSVSSPANQTVELGTYSTLVWNLVGNGGDYYVLRNGTLFAGPDTWASGVDIVVVPNNYFLGLWNYTLLFNDTVSGSGESSTTVNVVDNINPDCSELESESGDGGLTLASITIDGNVSDWAGVLANSLNSIADLTVIQGDPDIISTNDRDMIRSSFTYDDTNLFFYTKRTTRGSRQMSYIIYMDFDRDNLMESTDRVVKFVWSGTTREYNSDLYNYVPDNASGDEMFGDGFKMPGSITVNTSLETSIIGGTVAGTELETRVTWAALGLSGPTAINFKSASALGSGTNLPSQLEDSVGPVYSSENIALLFRPDREKVASNGTSVYYDHDIMNCGNGQEVIDLYNVSSELWNVTLFYPYSTETTISDTNNNTIPDITLNASQYNIVVVRIDVPANATVGTVDVTNITANYSGGNKSVIDTTSIVDIGITPESYVTSAAAGSVVVFNYTVFNFQTFNDTILINATSSLGWSILLRYPNGTLISGSLGELQPLESVDIQLLVTVPSGASIGDNDLTTVVINSTVSPALSDSSTANTTVQARLIFVQDYNRTVNVNTTEFYEMNITNNWNETDEFDLSYTSVLGWTTIFYDDDLVTPITSINVSGNGGMETFFVGVFVPDNVTFGVSEITTVFVNSTLNSSVFDSVVINETPRGVLIYNDSARTVLDTVFEVGYPGDNTTAFARAFYLTGIVNVSFGWYDDNGTLVRLSENISVNVNGTADDFLDMNTTSFLGFWTVIVYDSSDYSEVARTSYLLRDIIVPNVTGLVPVNGSAYTVGQTIDISANVTDNVDVDTVLANITYPNGTSVLLTLNFSSGTTYNNTFVIPMAGTFNITILANDTSNNLNNSETTSFTASVASADSPNVTAFKTSSPDPAVRGAQMNYTITVSNSGNASAFNVTVVESYPSSVVFHNSSPAPTSGNDTWFFASIGATSSEVIVITVNVSSSIGNGSTIGNSFNVTFANSSGVNTTISNSTNTTVLGFPVITASKSDSPDPVSNGSTLEYQILITNTGDDTAFNITVVESYPANVTFNDSSPVPSSGNDTWTFASLAPNQSTTINITMNVSETAGNGSILNNSFSLTFANFSGANTTISSNGTLTTIIIGGDDVPPEVFNLTPSGESFLLNETVSILGNVTDNLDLVDTVIFEITYPDGTMENFSTDVSGDTYNLTFLNLEQRGNYTIRIYANDTSGNLNDSVTFNFYRRALNVLDVVDRFGEYYVYTVEVTGNSSGLLNLTINVSGSRVTQMNITIHDEGSPLSIFRIADEEQSEVLFAEFAVDGSDFNFTNGSIAISSISDSTLFTCKDYNFSDYSCNESGNWSALLNLSIGQNYILNISPNDPGFLETSAAVDVALAPINDTAFVVAFVDSTENDVSFRIMNTNGSIIVGTTDVDISADSISRVDVAMKNTTHFVIGWVNGSADDVLFQIFDTTGTAVGGVVTVDADVGTNTDISLAELGSRFITCYANDADNDADFQGFTNDGTNVVAEANVDGNLNPGATLQNLVDCTAMNSTRWTYFWFDDGDNDVTFSILDDTGASIVGATDLDTNVGETGQVAVATLDDDLSAFVFYDAVDQDITIAVRDSAGTVILAPTDIDTDAGIVSRVAVGTVRLNGISTVDLFVPVWLDNASGDIKAAVYNSTGGEVTAPFTVDTSPSGTFLLLDVTGRDPITNDTICPGHFVVAYNNGTDEGFFKGFFTNGAPWDGFCDNSPPLVFDLRPVADTVYNVSQTIEIAANVTDDSAVDVVYAIITFPNGTQQNLTLTNVPATDKYNASFMIPFLAGTYNVSFFANDTHFNINNTEFTNFTAQILEPAVTVDKSDSPDPVVRGSQLTYSILINSAGNGTAFNVTLVETYPSGVAFHNSSPVPTSGNDTWVLGNLSSGTATTVNITLNVSSLLSNGTVLNNTVNVSFQNSSNSTFNTVDAENTTVITSSVPSILLVAPANNTNTSSTSITFQFNATDDLSSTLNCSLNINGTVNVTNSSVVNSSVTNVTVTGFAEGYYFWDVSCTDGDNLTNTSETRNFTVDVTPPDFNSLILNPDGEDALDPGVEINFTANVTDNITAVDIVVLHILLNGVSLINITMTPNGTDLFNASFTPAVAGNYSFFLSANDTVNNSDISTTINRSIAFESTWVRTPESFGAVFFVNGSTGNLGNLTINNTGDFVLSFNLSSSFNATFFNESAFNLSPGESRLIEVNVTAPVTFGTFPVNITITSNGTPSSNITTGTIVTTDNAFLFAFFTIIPTQVTQGQSGVTIEATVTNIGILNASNVTLNITLPNDWILTGGSLGAFFAELEPNQSESLVITVEIPANATLGLRNVTTYANGVNSSGADLAANNLTLNTTEDVLVVAPAPPFGGGGGGSGGGGGGGGAGGGGGGGKGGPSAGSFEKALEYPVLTTYENLSVVRGSTIGFPLDVRNIYQNSLMSDVTLRVEGYLGKYVSWTPEILENIGFGQKKSFFVTVQPPAYLDKKYISIPFIITGTLKAPGVEYRNGIPYSTMYNKKVIEYRTVTIELRDLTAGELEKLVSEVDKLYQEVLAKDYPHVQADLLVGPLFNALESGLYEEIPYLAAKALALLRLELSAGRALDELKQRIDEAVSLGLDISEAMLIYNIALKAFDNEDFERAQTRALEGMDVQFIEVKRAFNLLNFIQRYWWALLLVSVAGGIGAYYGYRRAFIIYLRRKTKELVREQTILQENIRSVQFDCFVRKSISPLDYGKAVAQLETALEKSKANIARLRVLRTKILGAKLAMRTLLEEQSFAVIQLKKAQYAYYIAATIPKRVYLRRSDELRLLKSEIELSILVLRRLKR